MPLLASSQPALTIPTTLEKLQKIQPKQLLPDLPQTFSQEEDHPQPPNLELTPARLKTQVKQKQVSEAADGGGGGAGNQEEGPASKKKKKTTRRQGVVSIMKLAMHWEVQKGERKWAWSLKETSSESNSSFYDLHLHQTCDSCRTRHFKCDLLERKEAITGVADDPEAPRGAKTLKQEFEGITCSRCSSKNVPVPRTFLQLRGTISDLVEVGNV